MKRVIRCIALVDRDDLKVLKAHVRLHLDYTDHFVIIESQPTLARTTLESILPLHYRSRFTYIACNNPEGSTYKMLEDLTSLLKASSLNANDIIVVSSSIEICEPNSILQWMFLIDRDVVPLVISHTVYQWALSYQLGRRNGARVFRAELLNHFTITDIFNHSNPNTSHSGWICLEIGKTTNKPYGAQVVSPVQCLIKTMSEPLRTS